MFSFINKNNNNIYIFNIKKISFQNRIYIMQISGKICEIEDEVRTSPTFKKRTFVIEYSNNPMYVDYISMELVQDRCSILDNFQKGDDVNVFFNLRGKKWVDNDNKVRYFNHIQAWRIDKISNGNTTTSSQQQHIESNIENVGKDNNMTDEDMIVSEIEKGDLPF